MLSVGTLVLSVANARPRAASMTRADPLRRRLNTSTERGRPRLPEPNRPPRPPRPRLAAPALTGVSRTSRLPDRGARIDDTGYALNAFHRPPLRSPRPADHPQQPEGRGATLGRSTGRLSQALALLSTSKVSDRGGSCCWGGELAHELVVLLELRSHQS